jgi:flagellar motor switch protein FliM
MATPTQSPSTNAPGTVLASGNIAPEQALPCDFRTVGGIDKARLARLITSTEGFTHGFAQALESRLGLTCETTLQSSEQVPCRKFLEKAGSAYMVSLHLGNRAETALLQMDSMLLFPVLDRLLGGSGAASELSRELTDIEDQIAKDVVRLVCQELQVAWQSFGVPVLIGERQSSSQLQTTFSVTDSALVFSLSVNLPSAGGGFQLMLPVASLGAFLATPSPSIREVPRKGMMNPNVADKALDWTFEVELTLPGAKIKASELLNLSVGKVFQLGVPVRTPVVLKIGGTDAFEAVPVRRGHHRGAQLLDRLPQSQPEMEKQNESKSN